MVDRERKTQVNENFFATWSPQMAYVLGFFSADGCMFTNPRGSKYVAFYSTDKELITKVKKLLHAKHTIGERKRDNGNWKKSFSIQIGSKKMYSDLLALGFMNHKADRLSLPVVPNEYMRHFARGYFDGDGCISYGYYRKKARIKPNFLLMVRFASCSKKFLENLSQALASICGLGQGCISRNKGGFHLAYSKKDTINLFFFMYNMVSAQEFLKRKYYKFKEAFELMGVVA